MNDRFAELDRLISTLDPLQRVMYESMSLGQRSVYLQMVNADLRARETVNLANVARHTQRNFFEIDPGIGFAGEVNNDSPYQWT